MALGRLLDNSPAAETPPGTVAYEPKANAPNSISETETERSNHTSDEIDEADFLKGLTEHVRDQDDLERDIANQVGPRIRTIWVFGRLTADGSLGG